MNAIEFASAAADEDDSDAARDTHRDEFADVAIEDTDREDGVSEASEKGVDEREVSVDEGGVSSSSDYDKKRAQK